MKVFVQAVTVIKDNALLLSPICADKCHAAITEAQEDSKWLQEINSSEMPQGNNKIHAKTRISFTTNLKGPYTQRLLPGFNDFKPTDNVIQVKWIFLKF